MMGVAEALERIFVALDHGQNIADVMRADERAAGYRVVVPGEVEWLSADDWDASVVVSLDGRRVRLVAILAKKQGAGAFTRLLGRINAAGLTPVVVAPTHEMQATLRRRQWKHRRIGTGFESQEIWYPRNRPFPRPK